VIKEWGAAAAAEATPAARYYMRPPPLHAQHKEIAARG